MLKRQGGFGLLLAVTGLLLGTAPSTASAKVRVAGGLAGEIEVDAPHQGVRPFTIPCCDWYWSRLTWY